jgi:hypothetical protein
MKKVRIWLSHPKLPLFLVLLAVGLTFPSLWNGLILDDYYHRLILLGDTRFSPSSASPLNLFCFYDGDPEENRRLMATGMFAWFYSEKLRFFFFRPLSSLTHWLDYLLWPDTPSLMYLQNLACFGMLVALASLLYRRIMGLTWVAGLAALFFAIDDSHGATVGSLANRNSLLACLFGVLCIIAHDRWRKEGWRSGALLGPLCFALSLLSAEAGLATGAYILSYTLFLERCSLRERIASMAPYGLVFFFWGMVYSLQGYGVQGIPLYTDPLRDPFSYLVSLFFRAPVYLLGQWALPPLFVYRIVPSLMHKAGLILTCCLALISFPLIRRYPTARFWTAGMLLSLLPICAVMPQERHLLFVGLGAMGLLAQWFFWIYQVEWVSKSRLWRSAIRILSVLFILIHVVIAAINLPISVRAIALFDNNIERVSASLPSGPEFKNRKFVLVNTPVYWVFVTWVIGRRAVQGRFTPLVALTSGSSSLVLTRSNKHTVEIRTENGSLTEYDLVFIKSIRKFSMQPGQIVKLDDINVEVLEVEDGLPSSARFRFLVPLEDQSLVWFRWQDGSYVPFTPPAVGETITIEGARFSMG